MIFNPNPKSTKDITDKTGLRQSPGESFSSYGGAGGIATYARSVSVGSVFGSDTQNPVTGPVAGTAGGVGTPTDRVGWTTDTGNRIQINGTPGAETIELYHHSGAAITIDADGAIFITPSGQKGFGLDAAKGDGVISAKNRIVIKSGAGVIVDAGSIDMKVRGNMSVDVDGDYNLRVNGSTNIFSNGPMVTETPKDSSEMIGGKKETTVAGDFNILTPSKVTINSGNDIDFKTDTSFVADAQQHVGFTSKYSAWLSSSDGNVGVISKKDAVISSEGGSSRLIGAEHVTLDAQKNVAIKAKENVTASTSSGSVFVDSKDTITMHSENNVVLNSKSGGLYAETDGGISIKSNAGINMFGHDTVDIRGATTLINQGAPSAASPSSVLYSDPRSGEQLTPPQKPKYPDANTIIDSMTTERLAPEFPLNGEMMNKEQAGYYYNEGDSLPGAVQQRTDPRAGVGGYGPPGPSSYSSPPYVSNGKSNGIKAYSNPYPLPSSHLNSSEKLSRYVTIGDWGNMMLCPAFQVGLTRAEIIANARHLAYNCLDPIIEHFGSSVVLLPDGAGLRIGNGGSMHYQGKAYDLRAEPRGNHSLTLEIAKWAAENVPYDRIYLEKNDAGTIHVHIEAAPPGQAGRGILWSCQDGRCRTRKEGVLDLNYAMGGGF